MRKLSWIIAGILCTTPVTLMAAELGAAKLESHLTERLKVIIPISGLQGMPLDEVKVRLAPEQYYEQAGIPLDSLAGNIMFQIKSSTKGPYVLVSSKRSISDPILSMLLEIKTNQGNFIKEYDLLLNPPIRGNADRNTAAQDRAMTPTDITQNSNSQALVAADNTPKTPVWHTIKDVPDVQMGGQYKVKRGDTLYEIAKQSAAKSSLPVRPLMQAIINANPRAFVDGNGNTLMAGATLKVPGVEVQQTNSTETAPATEGQAKLQLLSPDTETAGQTANAKDDTGQSQTDATSAESGAPKLAAINTQTQEQATSSALVQQNNEAIASIDAKSEAISHQIDLLNTQLKQVQDQIGVRNQSIEQLQKKIHDSQMQTKTLQQQLDEQKNSFWIQWGPYLAGGVGLLIIALLLLLFMGRGRRDHNERALETIEQNPASTANKPLERDITDAGVEQDQAEPAIIDDPEKPGLSTVASAASLAAMSGMATIPPFNAQTLIEESRLLVSYNLHAQAIDMLQDAISDHPDEVTLYQELARIHAESNNETALADVLAEIDDRFGHDQRPDLTDIQQQIAMQSAPIPIFSPSDEPVESLDLPLTDEEALTQSNEITPDFAPLEIDENPEIGTPEVSASASNDIEFSLDEMGESTPATPVLPNADEQSLDLSLDLPEMHSASEEPIAPAHEADIPVIELENPQVETETAIQTEERAQKNDTRLGLVEAFLGVGDLESYKMIAEEIEGEGDQELIDALRKIEKSHGV